MKLSALSLTTILFMSSFHLGCEDQVEGPAGVTGDSGAAGEDGEDGEDGDSRSSLRPMVYTIPEGGETGNLVKLSNGELLVLFDHANSSGNGYMVRFDASTLAPTSTLQSLSSITSSSLTGSSDVTALNGKFVIALRDGTDASKGKFVIYNNDFTSPSSLTTFEADNAASVAVRTLSNGNFVIGWRNGTNSNAYFRIYQADGTEVTSGAEALTSSGDVLTLTLEPLTGGGFAAIYSDSNTSLILFQILSASGASVVAEATLMAGVDGLTTGYSATPLSNGGFGFLYCDNPADDMELVLVTSAGSIGTPTDVGVGGWGCNSNAKQLLQLSTGTIVALETSMGTENLMSSTGSLQSHRMLDLLSPANYLRDSRHTVNQDFDRVALSEAQYAGIYRVDQGNILILAVHPSP